MLSGLAIWLERCRFDRLEIDRRVAPRRIKMNNVPAVDVSRLPQLLRAMPKALPLDPRAEMHSAADRMSSAYRRFLKAQAIAFGTC